MTKTLYKNFNLFNGIDNQIYKDAWLLVNNDTGKITQSGTGKQTPKANKDVDLKGQYVMPGLINVHTHVCLDPDDVDGDPGASMVKLTIRSIRNLRTLLKSGVTYVRGCGCSRPFLDTNLNKLQRRGYLKRVPEMMPAGQPMTMTGGHGDDGVCSLGVVDSPDEMRKSVRTNFKNGARCTKVMTSGGVMSPGDDMTQPQLTIPEIKVAVYETHARGTIIAAHAEGNPGIYNAIKAGVDSIEHGYTLTSEEIQMMVKQGTYLDPTLMPGWILNYKNQGIPQWLLDKNSRCEKHGYNSARRAFDAGVKLTLGTDAGSNFVYFDDTPKELELMVKKLGLTPYDALETSLHSAELMKLKDYGVLKPGKYADFLTLKKNPLNDIKAVQQKDKGVYKKGVKQY